MTILLRLLCCFTSNFLLFFAVFPAILNSFYPVVFRMSLSVHLKCVRTLSQHANRAWPHWGPRHLWHCRKDEVCVVLPLYLTEIFHCSVTFTSSLPRGQVSSSFWNLCLHSSAPWTSPRTPLNLIITVLNHLSVSKPHFLPVQTVVSLFLKEASMTSNHSRFLPQWPQPPVQTMNYTEVLVKLAPRQKMSTSA